MMPYVSVDIETTGLDPDKHQILEIAAVIEDWKSPVEELKCWSRFVRHDTIVGVLPALALNKDLLAEMQAAKSWLSVPPENVVESLRYFLSANSIDPMHITAAGKNFGGFDRQFIQKLPNYGGLIKFKHRTIDPGSLYWNPEKDNELPNTEECLRRAGLPSSVKHRALDDARDIIRLIRTYYGVPL